MSRTALYQKYRSRDFDEVVGQEHIIGKGRLLRRAIQADKLGSLIFYGPPGTGKTTLAKVIANSTKAEFTQLNATVAGKKDMEEIVHQAKDRMGMYGKKTILFVDEIQMSDEVPNPYNPDGKKITFYDALNDLRSLSNLDIYVTGSNSRMLSTDVVTQFRDRGDEIHLNPLSFREFR